MSLRLAARRLGLPATTTAPYAPSSPLTCQRRNKWAVNVFKGWGSKTSKSSSSEPSSSDYKLGQSLADPKSRRDIVSQTSNSKSASAPDSSNIFSDELDTGGEENTAEAAMGMQTAEKKTRGNTAMVLDPDPRSRVRWERKKVIQMVRRNGQVTREERIAMTERALTHRSDWIPTSTKKLVMLARQIAGKSVDDAITQMQWSKKKMAAEVKYYLEEARDLAVAQRGMGLGQVNGEAQRAGAKPRKIQTKDGKWVEVKDPTGLYVAESWVGRGEWLGKEIDYKGRGRMGVIVHPKTSITVVLKEDKTRIREYEEREAKKKAAGPWVHHPNRAIHGQRPYYTW